MFKCVVHTLEYPLSCNTHINVPALSNDERKEEAYTSQLSNHLSEDIHEELKSVHDRANN